jgi:copper chaperone CopZ
MRGLVYGIAAVAAVGIMIAIARTGGPESGDSAAPASAVATNAVAMEEAGTLTLAVPEMHCSFSCFPRVKEALEKNEAVEQVALGPQKVEGTIDNRQVVVQYKAGFEVDSALKMLATEGFTDSQVVQ